MEQSAARTYTSECSSIAAMSALLVLIDF